VVNAGEIDDWLAWQPRLLDFTDERLSTIAAKLNRSNPVHIIITDPELGEMRLSASLRSDNVEGLVRLLESHFAVRAEQRGAEIRLSSTKP
jgi:transmembrane sensor